jgi:Protein of unknown function (DUF3570)
VVPRVCKGADVAATELLCRLRAALRAGAALFGGLLAAGTAKAVDLPEDRAEAMIHVYDGGGVKAIGPAVLVRKRFAERYSISASYYVDAVSNASIDVVTTASPFKERRTAIDLTLDHVVRDGIVSVGLSHSKEPDYVAQAISLDASQEVFGGMTTVSVGFSRAADKVSKATEAGWSDEVTHWQWRAGITQILSPRWLASANFEAISDSGYLGSPYRVARVFGAAVPERNPRTRTSRAIKLRVIGDLGSRDAVRAEARFFSDTWDIKATTLEAGYSRYFGGTAESPSGSRWLVDGFVRAHSQTKALFYSDNASTETIYVSRNRQLSTFKTTSLGGRVTYALGRVASRFDVKLVGSYERVAFRYKDFTDVRTGTPYSFNANLLQVFASANF